MLVYDCIFCRKSVKIATKSETLFFDGKYPACPECYMRLQGADLSDIKKILLRIERKIRTI